MKRCPTCNRTFSDPNLSFCIEDGTPLIPADPAYDSEATIVSSSPSQGGQQSDANKTEAPSDWRAPAYEPPPQFPPPPPSQRKAVWPWVLGSLVLLVIVFVGLGIAAAVLLPRMVKDAENRNNNRSSIPVNASSNENRDSNVNSNINSNNDNENGTANNRNSNSAPPTNEEAVLADLKHLEDEWTIANVNADKKKLQKILADDYVGNNEGSLQSKADYLRDIKPDSTIQHWEFRDLKLTLSGTRATLTGTITLQGSEPEQSETLRFTDKFTWRDGRWQAVSSEVSQLNPTKEKI